ncbi:vacuolar ATP synthase subunit d, putative [Eimeria necatrix]|uniref:Vacuolar ATP synthase subunit d, putative n=1 Tax=Eimeria necatrix TaxID=51315 RepID=U6MXA8_9EIME|nr:vacuolar ATP synthase subunit d, putative [Eimeria necatrix]CDJ67653.1 vacuolar ATP synthase subunit d, putative [Eimeria necatrix]
MSSDAQVAPSRMTLQVAKQKKKGASQGYQLLKKKSDALSARFRGMLKEITKLSIGDTINEAHFSMAKASWAGGNDLREQLMQRIKRPAVFVTAAYDNVAGVRLPVFQITTDPTVDILKNINLSAGGHVILAARDKYQEALAELVKLASLQTAFFTLDSEIKMTNRRVNALSNVVLPKLDKSINYITKELDEMEREEFFRLKKIQEKKRLAKEAEQKALEEAGKALKASGLLPETILGEDDDDLVF